MYKKCLKYIQFRSHYINVYTASQFATTEHFCKEENYFMKINAHLPTFYSRLYSFHLTITSWVET